MYFDELPLDDRILDALYEMRYDICTPIQEKSIPVLLQGNDLLGIAQTGTGKTAAYLLPILNRICTDKSNDNTTKCLIMVPTRELAIQIDQTIEAFSYYLPITSLAVYGGNDAIRYSQEIKSLKLGADIIIATPGRLISHLQLENTNFNSISFFVLDEADRMLDMGFSEDIMKIASSLPAKRQTMLFSATMPEGIHKIAKSLLCNPTEIRIAVSKPAAGINQQAYLCEDAHKIELIKNIFKKDLPKRAIVFASSKVKVKQLADRLKKEGLNVSEMHSDLTQEERNKVMLDLKNGHLNILVATDIIARGIDVNDIQVIINYDVPHDAEDYIHRIGRTARAGKQGKAITIISATDKFYFKKIERVIGKEISKISFPNKKEKNESNQSRQNNKRKNYHRHPKKKTSSQNSEKSIVSSAKASNTTEPKRQHKRKRPVHVKKAED